MIIKEKHNYIPKVLFFAILLSVVILFFLTKNGEKKVEKESEMLPQTAFKTNLSSIQLIIKEKHYTKLKSKRDKALTVGILETSDDDYVPATIVFNNKEYKADIRLKGDWTDHLLGNKWSYRIKLKNDQTILGMRKFSIHHPSTRNYIKEWLYHKTIRDAGLVSLRYDFVEGILHIKTGEDTFSSENVGIYAVEETFDKRLIENNARREGIIVKITEDYYWRENARAWEIGERTGESPKPLRQNKFLGVRNEYIKPFSISKVIGAENLNKQFEVAKNLLEKYRTKKYKVSQVFDSKKLAKYIAISNLFGAYHGLTPNNLRYYYNPVTSLLEPISFDGNAGHELPYFEHFFFSMEDPIYMQHLKEALTEVTQMNYINAIFTKREKEMRRFEKELQIEFNDLSKVHEETIKKNRAILLKELERL